MSSRESKQIGGQKTDGRRPGTGASGPIRRELGNPLIRQLEPLCVPRTIKGVGDVLQDLCAIAAVVTVAVLVDSPVVSILTALYVGIRQRYLANLTHECAHLKLVKSKRANRLLGNFIATVIGESFVDYMEDHRVHHAKLGRDGDPKLRSYALKRATTPARDKREFLVSVVLANAVWDLPKMAVANWFTKPAREKPIMTAFRSVFWFGSVGIAVRLGMLEELAVYWLIPLVVVRPVIKDRKSVV